MHESVEAFNGNLDDLDGHPDTNVEILDTEDNQGTVLMFTPRDVSRDAVLRRAAERRQARIEKPADKKKNKGTYEAPSPNETEADAILRIYMNEVGQTPLLTKDDEIYLGKLVWAGLEASEQLNTADSLSLAERSVFENRRLEGLEAQDKLVKANLRLGIHTAKRLSHGRVPLLDVIQQANLGLMHAAEKFDHRKGFKFSTYATWWIRQGITRYIADMARSIRIPVHVAEEIEQLKRAQNNFIQENNRYPTTEEIAEIMRIKVDKVREYLELSRSIKSLNAPISDEDDSIELGDVIADKSEPPVDTEAIRATVKREINEALGHLEPREREILEMRYGVNTGTPATLKEIGEHFDVTRERIRQLEARAISKMRHPTHSSILSNLIDY